MAMIDPQSWRPELEAFRQKTEEFHQGTVDKGAYKGFSGLYGSYAQRGGALHMLRLRMTAGRVTKTKLAFVAEMLRTQPVPRLHFTTCQTIQMHDLEADTACFVMDKALDAGIVTIGGGGDYPRNVMCSPMTGVEPGEYFDVMPYAEAAADYLMTFVRAEKMPRKLKVCFSNSPKNMPHATFRDLGFVARADGLFDVYSAGGLGNNPRMGVLVAEAIDPNMIRYYIKAMWLTFRAYGNYENRAKARTRYMQEALGGPEAYAAAYRAKLQEVLDSGEDLRLDIKAAPVLKTGAGKIDDPRAIPQKQEGLYTVEWHPIGGQPDNAVFCAVSDAVCAMPEAELRLSADEGAYIINLNAEEAAKILELTKDDAAMSEFERSVGCIGASTCQVGLRDSQALLRACVKAVREAALPADCLPAIHISGCPSSCGTHQTNGIGFRGGVKKVDGKPVSGFEMYLGGCSLQGQEQMGTDLGAMAESEIPSFMVALGKAVADSGMSFDDWQKADPDGIRRIAAPWLE